MGKSELAQHLNRSDLGSGDRTDAGTAQNNRGSFCEDAKRDVSMMRPRSIPTDLWIWVMRLWTETRCSCRRSRKHRTGHLRHPLESSVLQPIHLHLPLPPIASSARAPRGLQKRLFGVPKLEDANMAGTKEVRNDRGGRWTRRARRAFRVASVLRTKRTVTEPGRERLRWVLGATRSREKERLAEVSSRLVAQFPHLDFVEGIVKKVFWADA